MSFYITIIGIDGSGKSTVTLALANLVPAELGLTTVAVGEAFWGKTPEEDLFRPDFAPEGELLVARLDRFLRKGAKLITTSADFILP
jgi:thymidylate kinase